MTSSKTCFHKIPSPRKTYELLKFTVMGNFNLSSTILSHKVINKLIVGEVAIKNYFWEASDEYFFFTLI